MGSSSRQTIVGATPQVSVRTLKCIWKWIAICRLPYLCKENVTNSVLTFIHITNLIQFTSVQPPKPRRNVWLAIRMVGTKETPNTCPTAFGTFLASGGFATYLLLSSVSLGARKSRNGCRNECWVLSPVRLLVPSVDGFLHLQQDFSAFYAQFFVDSLGSVVCIELYLNNCVGVGPCGVALALLYLKMIAQ